MGSPVQSATEAVQEAFANFHPEHMTDADNLLRDMSAEDGFFDQLVKSVGSLAGRFAEEMPVHSAVAEALQELAASLGGIRDESQELYTTFRRVHRDDLERLENPRVHEEMWDQSKNPG